MCKMGDAILILAPYPMTLVPNFLPNFTCIKSYTAAIIFSPWKPRGGGCCTSFFIPLPYPINLSFNVWLNITSRKRCTAANIGPQLGECAETYGTELHGNLWVGWYNKGWGAIKKWAKILIAVCKRSCVGGRKFFKVIF